MYKSTSLPSTTGAPTSFASAPKDSLLFGVTSTVKLLRMFPMRAGGVFIARVLPPCVSICGRGVLFGCFDLRFSCVVDRGSRGACDSLTGGRGKQPTPFPFFAGCWRLGANSLLWGWRFCPRNGRSNAARHLTMKTSPTLCLPTGRRTDPYRSNHPNSRRRRRGRNFNAMSSRTRTC